MRNHGWELPYHPLQVVAMTVFTELAFIFYVIFLPFVGGKTPQYVAVGIYTPLVTSVAVLYMWCVGTNPVCKSKNHAKLDAPVFRPEDQHSEENMSEVGISFCNLCEAEVLKNSKHCRECDKCVDGFDHHCKWLNNCIGKRNYKGFFTLLLSVVVLFVVQCLSGILVIILCIVKQGEFSRQIESELGCSFLTATFLIVVVLCTILATIAAKALAQLLWFHILLIKEGISTDDYIRAMREQEEVSSSVTGISAASSFSPVHRGTWLTPPRLFLDDQFDVIPPEIGTSQNPGGKKMKSKIIIPIVGRYPLAPLQLEASSAFQPSTAASSSRIAASSPGSDGYEAGGEDSDC